MKLIVLLLLLGAPVYAHSAAQTVQEQDFTAYLTSTPDQLEPDDAQLRITIMHKGEPYAHQDVTLTLQDKKKVFFSGDYATDAQGVVDVEYYFNGAGTYDLQVTARDGEFHVPVHVHGQYLLLFGFATALCITIALLFERI